MQSLAFGILLFALMVVSATEILLMYSTARARRPAGLEGDSNLPPEPNGLLEAFWTVLPALFLLALFGVSLQSLR